MNSIGDKIPDYVVILNKSNKYAKINNRKLLFTIINKKRIKTFKEFLKNENEYYTNIEEGIYVITKDFMMFVFDNISSCSDLINKLLNKKFSGQIKDINYLYAIKIYIDKKLQLEKLKNYFKSNRKIVIGENISIDKIFKPKRIVYINNGKNCIIDDKNEIFKKCFRTHIFDKIIIKINDKNQITSVIVKNGNIYHPNCNAITSEYCLGELKFINVDYDSIERLLYNICTYNITDMLNSNEDIIKFNSLINRRKHETRTDK